LRGERFRVVATHLEAFHDQVQMAQAAELLSGPLGSDLPVVLACDCNTPGDGSGSGTYAMLLGAGLSDPWSELHPDDPGYTCCQPQMLDNPVSTLSERIDFVFYRGDISAQRVQLVGDDPDDRTPTGLWPSDHAGVVARLRLAR
jgi:endonuclease/exonuclease/phosphatase family metal-dependent hydrolase